MTTVEQPPITPPERPGSRIPPWVFPTIVLLVALLVAAGFARWGHTGSQLVTRTAELSQADADKIRLANMVLGLCPDGQPIVDEISLRDCLDAQIVAAEPVVEVAAANGVSVAQVRAVVSQEIRAFADQRGRVPTTAELLGLIRTVYAENPPEDGRTPTPSELLAIAAQVYAQNPPADGADGEDGEDGARGEDGAACLPSIPECRGPQGVGVERGDFVRLDETCVYRLTLFNPADEKRFTADAPVPGALCGSGPGGDPVTTTAPPPTTTEALGGR